MVSSLECCPKDATPRITTVLLLCLVYITTSCDNNGNDDRYHAENAKINNIAKALECECGHFVCYCKPNDILLVGKW